MNIPANYLLIYGGDGLVDLFGAWVPTSLQQLPALGAFGCGIATALSMWTMALAMAYYTRRGSTYKSVAIWQKLTPPQWLGIRELVVVGVPIGVAFLLK